MKYELFKIEEDEYVNIRFSRFQTINFVLKVLKKKRYTTAYRFKKIVKILPKK